MDILKLIMKLKNNYKITNAIDFVLSIYNLNEEERIKLTNLLN